MTLAYDRTMRTSDEFGRLHVERTPITKANVCGYYGREIPGYRDLGLGADQMYQLYRDPRELAKAASTANRIQLLSEHHGVDAASPQERLVAGTLGSDAEFEAPYLFNSLTIWRREDIDAVESGERVELSCSYSYDPVMTPGRTSSGEYYDGCMTNIRFNHVALVPEGRVGSDVLVADARPMHPDIFGLQKGNKMANPDTAQRLMDLLEQHLNPAAMEAARGMVRALCETSETTEDDPPEFKGEPEPGGKLVGDAAVRRRDAQRRAQDAAAFARRFPEAARIRSI